VKWRIDTEGTRGAGRQESRTKWGHTDGFLQPRSVDPLRGHRLVASLAMSLSWRFCPAGICENTGMTDLAIILLPARRQLEYGFGGNRLDTQQLLNNITLNSITFRPRLYH
jgi:hypothetical protein